MDSVSTAEARQNLADLINRVAYGKERVVLTRHGKDVAALVPVEDLTLIERLRLYLRRRDVEDALRDVAARGGIELDELLRDTE